MVNSLEVLTDQLVQHIMTYLSPLFSLLMLEILVTVLLLHNTIKDFVRQTTSYRETSSHYITWYIINMKSVMHVNWVSLYHFYVNSLFNMHCMNPEHVKCASCSLCNVLSFDALSRMYLLCVFSVLSCSIYLTPALALSAHYHAAIVHLPYFELNDLPFGLRSLCILLHLDFEACYFSCLLHYSHVKGQNSAPY